MRSTVAGDVATTGTDAAQAGAGQDGVTDPQAPAARKGAARRPAARERSGQKPPAAEPDGQAKPDVPPAAPSDQRGRATTSPGPSSQAPVRTPAAAAPAGSSTAAVRRRLARLGAPRSGAANPVLEPLIKTVRGTHPKADIRVIERAYGVVRGKGKGKERTTVKVDATRLGCVYTSAPPLCHRFRRLGDVGQGPMV